ncbi:hypothetical protein [Mesorhizobium sp. ANAO-SY3R2]|uniref:hypothetical protein n=1 Tax=Mesorhizobium sp. ANAO-SY3R2 TaxID=3166644 RepID=UPI00367291EE
MRSMALTAALAAIVVSLPLSMASAGGRDRDRGNDHGGGGHHDSDRGKDHGGKDHGHHDRDRDRGPDHIQGRVNKNALAIAGSKGFTDGDITGSEALTYGKTPPTCSPYRTTWTCIPPQGYAGYR